MKQKALTLLSFILAMVLGMGNASAQALADVTGSTTWNWALSGVDEVKLTAETTPTKSEEFVLSQVIPSTDQFKSDALLVSAEYPVRSGKFYQGGYIKFHVTVPGTVKVTFSNTGNRYLDDKTTEDESLRRWLYINGNKTASGSCLSSSTVTSDAIPVDEGDVVITSFIDGTEASQYIRVYSIEFVESEEHADNPTDGPAVDPSAAHLLWDYSEGAPTENPDNGLTYASVVKDGPGTKNGLYGIKMNSSGYAYFTKEAVAGTLKLSFGPRDGSNASSLNIYTFAETPGAETLIATTPEVTEYQTVSVELTADQNNIYINRAVAVEQVLQKLEFVPLVPRTFQDVELDFMNISALPAVPAGVTSLEGSPRGDSHGLDNFKMVVPVDGPVKITLGGCQYSNTNATILNAAGETIASIDVKTPGCYHNKGVATWIYTGESDVLTIVGAQYSPYIKIEAVEIAPCTVIFKDQNGNVIGTKDAFEGDALGDIPFGEQDLPLIPESQVFRGWVYASGIKAKATDALSGNTTISALVTPWEAATQGSVQTYPLTSNIFYPEDHELISIEGGYYHDAQHGWALASGGKISVDVAGNAQIILSLCKYSKDAAITVTDENGNTVQTIASGMVENDGATATVNYKGDATTLTFTLAQGESYIHSITVYNVQGFVEKDAATGYYIIPANDGAAFLLALNSANSEADAKIFLPNGTYDLGETVGTTISGSSISIIGESMEGVIIMNAPDVKLEGLGKADLLYNTSSDLYLQDITLKNALDYYSAGSAGRACSLHDAGKNTIAKNVNLLSYQDTYYSHKDGSYFYWEGGEIHGTVDYLCGSGNVYYNGVTLVNESRSASSASGECTISAASTNANDKGYVFDGCTIKSLCSTFNLGRSWNTAKTVFLNTTIESGKLIDTRWNTNDINSDPVYYYEYNTIDNSGNGKNTPASNELTFAKGTTMETVISADKAKEYSYENFFNAGWDPKAICAQEEVESIDSEAIYLVESDGKFVSLAKGSSLSSMSLDGCTLRKANARGGFGAPSSIPTAVKGITTPTASTPSLYNVSGQRVDDSFRGIVISNGKKMLKK